jgi:hypothetical protein
MQVIEASRVANPMWAIVPMQFDSAPLVTWGCM